MTLSIPVTSSSHSNALPELLPGEPARRALHGGHTVEVAAASPVELEELQAAPAPSALATASGNLARPVAEAANSAEIEAELGAHAPPGIASAITHHEAAASVAGATQARTAARPSWARRLLRQIDVHAVTTRADDRALRSTLKTHGSTVRVGEKEVDVSVGALRHRLEEYRRDIERYKAILPARRVKRLQRIATALSSSLDTVEHGRPRTGLFIRAAALFLLCAPAPIAVPYSLKEEQYAAIMTASYTKTVVMLAGLLVNEFSDNRALWNHFNQRHLVNLALSVPYMIPTYLSRIKGLEGLGPLPENSYFNAGVALFAGAAFLYRSYPEEIKAAYRKIEGAISKAYRGGAGLVSGAAARFGGEPPLRIPETLLISEEVRQVYADLLARARQDRKGIAELRERYSFDKTGKSVSSIANRKLGDMESDYRQLEQEIVELFPQLAEQAEGKSANPELAPKLAFAILSFIVCSAATALMWPDTLGVLDMGVDDLGVSAYMFALAFLARANVQDMEDAFRSFVGMSALAIVFLGTNKLMMLTGATEAGKGFMDTTRGRAIGTVALDLANLTLPGPMGYVGAAGIRRLLSALMRSSPAGQEEGFGQGRDAARAPQELEPAAATEGAQR